MSVRKKSQEIPSYSSSSPAGAWYVVSAPAIPDRGYNWALRHDGLGVTTKDDLSRISVVVSFPAK